MEQLNFEDATGGAGNTRRRLEESTLNPDRSIGIRRNTKRWNVLKTLLDDGPLTCFDAVRRCRDYVLRSTVSELQSQFGIRIDRELIQVPNGFGGTTTCARYWIGHDQRTKALQLLGETK